MSALALDLHLIEENCATDKHPKVNAWLKQHRRFRIQYAQIGASWQNMVERFFRDLATRCVRASISKSVAELEAAIVDYRHLPDEQLKTFICTANTSD